MLRLTVVDISAESRSRLVQEISAFQESGAAELSLLPQLSIQQLAPEELKFHGAPDICIVGDELVSADINLVGKIKKLLPDTPLVVRIPASNETLMVVEDLARLGVDDVFTNLTDPLAFFKKIILLCRRPKRAKGGHLILVDSAKGGLGVTSVAVALAEAGAVAGQKVALLDLDLDTQDASRFLQSRPYLNENLETLLARERPVTEESVRHCLIQVWEGEDNFWIMPPPPLLDDLGDYGIERAKVYLTILEVLDSLFDLVIVDLGSARGNLLKTLYRSADKVLMVVGNDPACLYATANRISSYRGILTPTTQILFLENAPSGYGLPREVLVRELSTATRTERESWLPLRIPFCRLGSRWPGSGETLFSRGSRAVVKAIRVNAQVLGIGSRGTPAFAPMEQTVFESLVEKLKDKLPAPRLIPDAVRESSKVRELKLIPHKETSQDEKVDVKRIESIFESLVEGNFNRNGSDKNSELGSSGHDQIDGLFKAASIS